MACSQVTPGAVRDLECPVCHEVFRMPKILPCGHSVCGSPCLAQLAGDQRHVKCPECRAPHPVPDGGVTIFPTNFFICRIVESTISRRSVDQSVCPGCSVDSVMLKRCAHCGNHICQNCRDQHTDVLKEDLIKKLAECSDKVKSGKITQNDESTIEKLTKTVSFMHEEVDRVTKSFHHIIDQRILKLKQGICDFETNEMSNIWAQRQPKKDSIIAFCEEKQLTLGSDVSHMTLVKIEEELTDMIENYKMGASDIEASDAALSVNEKAVSQLLSTFGEMTIMHSDEVKGTLDIRRSFTDVKNCIGRRGSEPGFFDSPTAVQVSPRTGNIIVAERNNKRIQIFSPEGKFIHSFTEPYDGYCSGSVKHLDICHKGHIFILNDTAIASFTEKGQQLSEFDVTEAITFALAPNGYIHVGKSQGGVDVLNKGTLVASYAVGNKVKADRICISKSGLVYILHFTKMIYCRDSIGPDVISVFNDQFQLIKRIEAGVIQRKFVCTCQPDGRYCPEYCNRSPRGSFRLINENYFLVTDLLTHAVMICDLQFDPMSTFGKEGTTVGHLFHPRDAAVTLHGDVVVVSDNNMMQFF